MAYHHHHQRQTDPHVCQIYDLIIDQVVQELTPLLVQEGMSTDVLHALRQLWKEKLTTYGVGALTTGDFRGTMSRAQHFPPHDFGHAVTGHTFGSMGGHIGGLSGVDGLGVIRQQTLPSVSELLTHGVRVKPEGSRVLAQTDGVAEEIESGTLTSKKESLPFHCPAAILNNRMPKKGDLVSLTLSLCSESSELASAIDQVDGLGRGAKRRKTGDDGGYDEEVGVGEEDDGGGEGNEEEDLNSADDDEDDGDVEKTAEDVILCRYDKVTRQKQKWKTQFRDGMMRAKGRDFLFKKGAGDMNFSK